MRDGPDLKVFERRCFAGQRSGSAGPSVGRGQCIEIVNASAAGPGPALDLSAHDTTDFAGGSPGPECIRRCRDDVLLRSSVHARDTVSAGGSSPLDYNTSKLVERNSRATHSIAFSDAYNKPIEPIARTPDTTLKWTLHT